jgi:type II secretion system protein I
MKRIDLKSNRGITILEVLIAMVVLSLSLLLLLNMAMVALDGNDWSNKTSLATQQLQEKMEQLRVDPDPTSGSDESAGIKRSWTVEKIASHLRRVDVDVEWADVRRRTKTNTMTAFIKTEAE